MSASQASSYRDVVQGKFACSPGRTREVDLWAWACLGLDVGVGVG
jgi:hypothetical protein